MPAPKLPDPSLIARAEADAILANRAQFLRGPLERVLADAPWCDPAELTRGIEQFYNERMAKIPPAAKYPEARPWVDFVVGVDRDLRRLASLSDYDLAVYRSLHEFLLFRGFRLGHPPARPPAASTEKCRIAYLPDSDEGPVHIKNVDDPAVGYKGEPLPTKFNYDGNLVVDGVGSGLHIDDEPDEIFPLPIFTMLRHYAADVPAAVEFLTRYGRFWGGGNQVLHDRQKRSVAIEKCGRCFIEVFPPDRYGHSHCSGMVCRDPGSPLGKHQKAKRDEYCRLYGLKDDGADRVYWAAADVAEKKLADGLDALGPRANVARLFKLFTTPWPEGLNKDGALVHLEQSVPEYTLVTRAALIDKRRYYHWQRDPADLTYPAEPEVVQF